MTLSPKTTDPDYLQVVSPDGNHVAEFNALFQSGEDGPDIRKLWVNGKAVDGYYSSFYWAFGPSCAWSPDSRYLTLIMQFLWSPASFEGNATRFAIYDVKLEELRVVKDHNHAGVGNKIDTYKDAFNAARVKGFDRVEQRKTEDEIAADKHADYEAMIRRWTGGGVWEQAPDAASTYSPTETDGIEAEVVEKTDSNSLKKITIFGVVAGLLYLFIQGGRYITTYERHVADYDSGRNAVVIPKTSVELGPLSHAETMSRKRIVGGGILDNPNFIDQTELDRLKALSASSRARTLDLYRAFRDEGTPKKKTLIVETASDLKTIETVEGFDQWVLTAFPE